MVEEAELVVSETPLVDVLVLVVSVGMLLVDVKVLVDVVSVGTVLVVLGVVVSVELDDVV